MTDAPTTNTLADNADLAKKHLKKWLVIAHAVDTTQPNGPQLRKAADEICVGPNRVIALQRLIDLKNEVAAAEKAVSS